MGHIPEEHTWVNAREILDPTLIEDFHRTHTENVATRPHGGVRTLLSVKIPQCPLYNTRGNPPLSFDPLPSYSISHHSSDLVPISDTADSPINSPSLAHLLRCLDLPRLSLLSVSFVFCLPFPCLISNCSSGFWFASCLPRPKPAYFHTVVYCLPWLMPILRPCLCFVCCCWLFLNKSCVIHNFIKLQMDPSDLDSS